MLRQRSRGKQSDRFIPNRSSEREILIDRFTIKDENSNLKLKLNIIINIVNKNPKNRSESEQKTHPFIRTTKIMIDDKENSKKIYLSLLKSQIFKPNVDTNYSNQKKIFTENFNLIKKKRIRENFNEKRKKFSISELEKNEENEKNEKNENFNLKTPTKNNSFNLSTYKIPSENENKEKLFEIKSVNFDEIENFEISDYKKLSENNLNFNDSFNNEDSSILNEIEKKSNYSFVSDNKIILNKNDNFPLNMKLKKFHSERKIEKNKFSGKKISTNNLLYSYTKNNKLNFENFVGEKSSEKEKEILSNSLVETRENTNSKVMNFFERYLKDENNLNKVENFTNNFTCENKKIPNKIKLNFNENYQLDLLSNNIYENIIKEKNPKNLMNFSSEKNEKSLKIFPKNLNNLLEESFSEYDYEYEYAESISDKYKNFKSLENKKTLNFSAITNNELFNSNEKKNNKTNLNNLLLTESITSNIPNKNDFNYENTKSSFKKLLSFEIENEIYREFDYNYKSQYPENEYPDQTFGYFNYLKSYNKSLSSLTKNSKKVSKVPYKVLDAPLLKDDYYLHLLDWSKKDLLAVGLDKSIYIWEGKSSNVINLQNYLTESITSIAWIKDQEYLAIGLNSGLIEIWDLEKNKVINTYMSHKDRVATIAPQFNNYNVFSSGSQDKSIFSFDLRQFDTIANFVGHSQEICGLKWSPDDRYLASGGNDNKLFIWSLRKNNYENKFAAHKSAIKALDWSPHKYGFLLSGGGTQDRTIKLWNISQMKLIDSIDTSSQVCNIAFSKNSKEFVSTHGFSDNLVLVWDSEKMEVKNSLKGHKERVIYLSLGPDGEKIATGAGDETIRFWDVFNNKTNLCEKVESKLDVNLINLR